MTLSNKYYEKVPLLVGLDNFAIRPGGLGRAFNYICKEFENDKRKYHRIEIGLERNGKKVLPESLLIKRVFWLLLQSRDLRSTTSYMFSHYAMHALVLSVFIKAPLFTFFHGPWAEESIISKKQFLTIFRIKKCIEKIVYQRSKKIFCASESFKKILIERYEIPEEKIQVVSLGVDLQLFSFVPKNEARKLLQINESDSIFVSVRRLTNRMGQKDLIDAFNIVLKQSPNCYLYLIGNGLNKIDYEQQIEKLGISGRVKILSEVSDNQLPLWYAAADVSIVPSNSLEGFGLVVLESLACGTPVIATKCAGLEELVAEWNSQFLVDIGSSNKLAAKMFDFLNGNLQTSNEDNLAFASQFTWNKCFHAIAQELDEISITFLSSESLISGAELSLFELVSVLGIGKNSRVLLGKKGDLYQRMSKLQMKIICDSNLVIEFDSQSSFLQLLREIILWPKKSFVIHKTLQADMNDYVFINTFKTLVMVFPHLLISRRQTIFWAHDSFLRKRKSNQLKNLFYKIMLRKTNLMVICNSHFTSDTLWEALEIKSDLVLYPYVKTPTISINQEFRIPNLIGISGRISSWKGQLFALKAMEPLFADFPELTLEILGSPLFNDLSYFSEIKNFLHSATLSERVVLTPFTDNPFSVISRWSLSVHSSLEPEPFGRTIVDSLIVGVPVLVPNSGGPLEIVKYFGNCLIYKMGDSNDLRAKVESFLLDKEMGEKIRRGSSKNSSKMNFEIQLEELKKSLREKKSWQR